MEINKNKLNELFQSFVTGLNAKKSENPRKHLKSLGLDHKKLEIGFNSGQFHHRKDEGFIRQYLELGVLQESDANNARFPGKVTYSSFGSYGIIFPLKDKAGGIVNFWSDRFKLDNPVRAFLNEKGIYPSYPKATTKRLFILDNILDTASFMQADVMQNEDAVMSLFDTKLKSHQIEAIQDLKYLEEVVYITCRAEKREFDEFENIQVLQVSLPELHSMNDMLLNYQSDGVLEFIQSELAQVKAEIRKQSGLIVHHEQKLEYVGEVARYEVLGYLPTDISSMRVGISVIEPEHNKKFRLKLDLFNHLQVAETCQKLAEQQTNYFDGANGLIADLTTLSDLLEEHRDIAFKLAEKDEVSEVIQKEQTPSNQKKAMDLLTDKNLIPRINNLLELTGIIGNEDTRLTQFIIGSSYKMAYPMHSIIQGTSGSGKTHLLQTIAECMPTEDVLDLTRVTPKSLYNYEGDDLINKLILVQDFDGMNEDAQLAFREMQSAGYLSSSTSKKTRTGDWKSSVKKVMSHFASITATTNDDVYFDNASRSVFLGIDESEQQTQRIIEYQNSKMAGEVDKTEQLNAKLLLRNLVRLLKSKEVINPFAKRIDLPLGGQIRRRLNEQFNRFVCQITILHQYQREENEAGKLIATREDVELAIKYFFNPIILKVDDLDAGNRQLFDLLKSKLKSQPQGLNSDFTARRVRELLSIGKTKTHSLLKLLTELGFVQVIGGSPNRGFTYKLGELDTLDKTREQIKQSLTQQLEEL